MAGPAQPAPQPHPLVHSLVPIAAVHPVRVASHSSLHSLVGFALSHLGTPSCPPLVLHSLPPPSTAAPTDPAVAALPKLVSLHQLVLRASPSPLHSYTLVDSFERHGIASPAPPQGTDAATADEHEQMRQDLVALEWLSGRAGSNRRPRRKHTPLMLIVVSPTPLDLPSSFTHQPPTPLSRNAKRALKRPAPAPPPPAPQAAAEAGPGDAAPDADAEEGEERTGAGAEAGPGASEGAGEPRKRRRRRRGKGGGGGSGETRAAAAQGASESESKGEGEGEGGEAGGMDVDAAAGA